MTKTPIPRWGLGFKLRRVTAKSWLLSRCYYRRRGARLLGRPQDQIWYFAYGANMHEATFRVRRGIQPLEHRSGRIKGYRVRFNLEGRPKEKAAPANLYPDPDAEVWGVLYRITRRDLMRLDSTEGVPGRGYRHVEIEAEDCNGRMTVGLFAGDRSVQVSSVRAGRVKGSPAAGWPSVRRAFRAA